MKQILYYTIFICFYIVSNEISSQTLPEYKFDTEPIKPYFAEYDAFKSFPKIEYINGKIVSIEETKSEYNKRNAIHKKILYNDYLNSKIYKEWYAEHLIWRRNNLNWKEITRYPELLNQNERQDIIRPVPKIGEIYIVNTQTLKIRSAANKTASILGNLKYGDEVKLLNSNNENWWLIQDGEIEGFVFSQFLKLDPNTGWNKKHYESGETPDCENVDPQYDYKIDNYLKVNVGSNTDVVIKLMKKQYDGDICIRIVFVRNNETYFLKNIPEGIYYLKIAYGKDWRQKIVDQHCYGKFMKNAQYEIGKDKLDFNIINSYNRTQVPSFELSLNVIVTRETIPSFKSNDISEAEFNK